MTLIITHKYKVYGKPQDFRYLDNFAWEVNRVWNYCIDAASYAWKHHSHPKWFYADASLKEAFAGRVIKKSDDSGRIRVSYEGPQQNSEFLFYNPHVSTFSPDKPQTLTVRGGYLSGYDFEKLCAGVKGLFFIPSSTVSATCQEFDKSWKTKAKLIGKGQVRSAHRYFMKYRGKKSRQWVPFKGQGVKIDHQEGVLTFAKKRFKLNLDRPIDGELADGKFVKEPDGWYVCLALKIKSKNVDRIINDVAVGLDLGVKTLVTLSNGMKFSLPDEPEVSAWGRTGSASEILAKLKSLRDRSKNRRPKNDRTPSTKLRLIDVKIQKIEKHLTRWREHHHYDIANKIAQLADTVVVGDLNGKFIQGGFGDISKGLSIGLFKTRLEWICKRDGKTFQLVNESCTTVTCSTCGEKTGPTGEVGLSVRTWGCSGCGSQHDRDVNAAKNILAIGLAKNKEQDAAAAS